jgi:hypothetical protein
MEPLAFRSPQDVANAAAMHRRSMDRHLGSAGLATALSLLRVARALTVYRLLRAGRRVQEVMRLMEYHDDRTLSVDLYRTAGCCARELRTWHDEGARRARSDLPA